MSIRRSGTMPSRARALRASRSSSHHRCCIARSAHRSDCARSRLLKHEQVIETELETAPPHEFQPRRLEDPRRLIRGESVVLLEGHTVDEAQGAEGLQNTID